MTRVCAVLLALGIALPGPPVLAAGPFPTESWEVTLEFRPMPMKPQCGLQAGSGTLRQSTGGRNPACVLSGFPTASAILCRLPHGGTFRIDAALCFDLPEDGVWGGNVDEAMGPGDLAAVQALFTDRQFGPVVEGPFWLDTANGRNKEAGGSMDMLDALAKGARQ